MAFAAAQRAQSVWLRHVAMVAYVSGRQNYVSSSHCLHDVLSCTTAAKTQRWHAGCWNAFWTARPSMTPRCARRNAARLSSSSARPPSWPRKAWARNASLQSAWQRHEMLPRRSAQQERGHAIHKPDLCGLQTALRRTGSLACCSSVRLPQSVASFRVCSDDDTHVRCCLAREDCSFKKAGAV